jgi:hypothetical protein
MFEFLAKESPLLQDGEGVKELPACAYFFMMRFQANKTVILDGPMGVSATVDITDLSKEDAYHALRDAFLRLEKQSDYEIGAKIAIAEQFAEWRLVDKKGDGVAEPALLPYWRLNEYDNVIDDPATIKKMHASESENSYEGYFVGLARDKGVAMRLIDEYCVALSPVTRQAFVGWQAKAQSSVFEYWNMAGAVLGLVAVIKDA